LKKNYSSNLPKISIVTPSYNQSQFIKEAIESIRNQNYANYEHIIIDGESTDDTISILEAYHDYAELKWISEPDDGQSDALNKGFHLATGDWILWLNSDDILLPGAIKKLVEQAEKITEIDVIYGHAKFINQEGKDIRTVYAIPYKFGYSLFQIYVPATSGSLFRASILKKFPLDNDFHYTMDVEWFLRVGNIINTAVLDYVTTGFRVWGGNKTSARITEGTIKPQHALERKNNRDKYFLTKYNRFPKYVRPTVIVATKAYYLFTYYLAKLKYGDKYLLQKTVKN
jgi:glycosyltransferase involved in cell wall biosynthesis